MGKKMSGMAPLRQKIDQIDDQLITLLSERLALVEQVIAVKQAEGLPARIPHRIDEVLAHVTAKAAERHVPEDLVRTIWAALIEATCQAEEAVMGPDK